MFHDQHSAMPGRWRKSTYSSQHGNCLAAASDGGVLVRDTHLGDASPVLKVPPGAWRSFTSRLKDS